MIASTAVSDYSFSLSPIAVHDHARVVNDCLHTLQVFVAPGQVTQLVAFDVQEPGNRAPVIYSGFFDYDHLDLMAEESARLSGHAKGVHFTLNPLKPEVLNRCPNRVQLARAGVLARDSDVSRRSWLMIDLDPVRPAGMSASDEEKQLAIPIRNRVTAFLFSVGFPPAIIGDSGNGYHLYYSLDLPANDKRPHDVLKALRKQFNSEAVKIDTSVAKASQLTKLFGTLSAKGKSTEERPHRYSSLPFVSNSVTVSEDSFSRLILPARSLYEGSVPIEMNQSVIIERAHKYLKTLPASESGKHGHDRLFEAACRLVQGFGLSQAQALPLLIEYNLRSVPAWPESELERKLTEASTRIDSRPAAYLLNRNAQSQGIIAAGSPTGAKGDVYDDPLPGPAYPVSIPDFVPVPTGFVTEYLERRSIELPRGRPKLECHQLLVWLSFYGLYEQHRTIISIPDCVMSSGVGGASPSKGWRCRVIKLSGNRRSTQESMRTEVRRLIDELKDIMPVLQDAMERDPETQVPVVEQAERLTSRINELQAQILPESCSACCPMHESGVKHEHYILRPNEQYWGAMRELIAVNPNGHVEFDFDKKIENKTTTVLESLVRSNKVTWAYLPVQLFGQAAGLNVRQIRLIQGLMRERTRTTRMRDQGTKKSRVFLVRNASVMAARGKARVVCPFLDSSEVYIAFGGNLKQWSGRGYRLFGRFDEDLERQGGWLRRLGYRVSCDLEEEQIWKWIGILLEDLAKLSQSLGLVAAAVDKHGRWRSLDEIRLMVKEGHSCTWLKTCSLRIFAPADYLVRWRHWFAKKLGFSCIPGGDWSGGQNRVCPQAQTPTADSIRSQLKAAGIKFKQLASHMKWNESRVSRQLNGKTRLSPKLVAAAQLILDENRSDHIA